MSTQLDAEIIKLKRKGELPSDFSLEPDYGGPKTTLQAVDEFFQDLPANLTFGLIPKANPYERLTPLQRRELDASRQATLSDALLKQQTDIINKANEENRQLNEETKALDDQRLVDLLENIERTRAASALEQIRTAGEVSTDQSIKQMQALYPYLDRAGQKAIERNLDASMRFKAFKEQLPSSIQAIMESKQRQQQLASDAFAREAGAIATQQQQATAFGQSGIGRYSGRRIA